MASQTDSSKHPTLSSSSNICLQSANTNASKVDQSTDAIVKTFNKPPGVYHYRVHQHLRDRSNASSESRWPQSGSSKVVTGAVDSSTRAAVADGKENVVEYAVPVAAAVRLAKTSSASTSQAKSDRPKLPPPGLKQQVCSGKAVGVSSVAATGIANGYAYASNGGAIKRGCEDVEAETEDDLEATLLSSSVNYSRRSPPKKPKSVLTSQEMNVFFELLQDEEIQCFLSRDACCLISDKYALAMVFTYFKRAKFVAQEYTTENFYLALYLASDIEEDVDEYKYEIFPWALGYGWRSLFTGFLRKRDVLLRRIGYRAIVSRKCCEEVMSFAADHAVWKRERAEDHGGATRAYMISYSKRFLSSKHKLEEEELNLPRMPNEPPRPCTLCLLNRGWNAVTNSINTTATTSATAAFIVPSTLIACEPNRPVLASNSALQKAAPSVKASASVVVPPALVTTAPVAVVAHVEKRTGLKSINSKELPLVPVKKISTTSSSTRNSPTTTKKKLTLRRQRATTASNLFADRKKDQQHQSAAAPSHEAPTKQHVNRQLEKPKYVKTPRKLTKASLSLSRQPKKSTSSTSGIASTTDAKSDSESSVTSSITTKTLMLDGDADVVPFYKLLPTVSSKHHVKRKNTTDSDSNDMSLSLTTVVVGRQPAMIRSESMIINGKSGQIASDGDEDEEDSYENDDDYEDDEGCFVKNGEEAEDGSDDDDVFTCGSVASNTVNSNVESGKLATIVCAAKPNNLQQRKQLETASAAAKQRRSVKLSNHVMAQTGNGNAASVRRRADHHSLSSNTAIGGLKMVARSGSNECCVGLGVGGAKRLTKLSGQKPLPPTFK